MLIKKLGILTGMVVAILGMNNLIVHAEESGGCLAEVFTTEIVDDSFLVMVTNEPERISEKYSNIIDIEQISLDKTQSYICAEAYELNEGGRQNDMDCEVTLNKIVYADEASTVFSVENTSTCYILSALSTTKISEDELKEDGKELYGCIVWEDVFGPGNKFKYAAGYRKGTFSGLGTYQVNNGNEAGLGGGKFSSDFTVYSDETSGSFSLYIYSYGTDGKQYYLHVKTSIFD